MKYVVLLIVWMVLSLILVCSIIGLILFARTDFNCDYHLGDDGRSTWAIIGLELLKKVK